MWPIPVLSTQPAGTLTYEIHYALVIDTRCVPRFCSKPASCRSVGGWTLDLVRVLDALGRCRHGGGLSKRFLRDLSPGSRVLSMRSEG